MKTVRFSKVVQKAGKPEVYLLWSAPDKDPVFRKALQAGRIMTVHQEHGQTDYGTVGYTKGAGEQILIFPKPLKTFRGNRIVGVKYEMVTEEKIPISQLAKLTKASKSGKRKGQESPKKISTDEESASVAKEKVHTEKRTRSKSITSKIPVSAKKQIQKAMRFLKAGKQVQAYDILEGLNGE